MPRDELEKLAQRVELEPVSYELWKSALMLLKTGTPSAGWYDDPSYFRFTKLLESEAWRDAAAMLMLNGWFCDLDDQGNGEVVAKVWELDHGVEHIGAASAPHAEARARLAAALRARAIAGRS